MFINLFLLNFRAHGFNHIAPGENFVQHAFAENLIPAARAARGNTADNHGFLTAVIVGNARSRFARTNFIFLHGADGFFRRGSVAGYPIYKRRVEGGIVAVHIGPFPIQVNAGRNQVGKQIVKFHNAAFFGVVGSQHFDILFIRQGVGSQRRKYAFGAAFHKQPYTGIIGGLQLFDPFYGMGNLRNH